MTDSLALRATLLLLMVLGAGISRRIRGRADAGAGTVRRAEDPLPIRAGLAVAGGLFYGSLVVWLVYPPALAWAAMPIGAALRWVGAALLAVGVALSAWALQHLGRNVTPTGAVRPDATLVTTGPYRLVRHPLYASMLATIPGVSLLTANLLVAVAGTGTFLVILWRLGGEEHALRQAFGEEYERYAARTGKLVPGIGRTTRR